MVTLAISCEGIVVISFLPYTSHIFSPLPEGLSHGKTPPLVFSCVLPDLERISQKRRNGLDECVVFFQLVGALVDETVEIFFIGNALVELNAEALEAK